MSFSIIRAAIVAGVVGVSALAVPVQAANFSFSFGIGDTGSHRGHFPRLCLTDYQLRHSIEDRGYSRVALNVELNNRIKARGTKGAWVYQLTLNACTGEILDRERLRRS